MWSGIGTPQWFLQCLEQLRWMNKFPQFTVSAFDAAAQIGRYSHAIYRRTFSAALVAGAAASLTSARGIAAVAAPIKARIVVLVHGLFADGSCWSEVIARLQAAGLNAT